MRLEWLTQMRLLCPNCKTPYRVSDMRIVSKHSDPDGWVRWYIRCLCGRCSIGGVTVIQERVIDGPPEPVSDAITVDDTLAAHEALKTTDHLPPDITGGLV